MKMKVILSMAVLGIAPCCLAARAPTVPQPVPPVTTTASPNGPAPMAVPTTYVWDGHEYVGVVAGHDYYLAHGNVWMLMGPARHERFLAWEKSHPNWQGQQTQNVRYQNPGKAVQPETRSAGTAPPDTRTVEPSVNAGIYGPK